MVHLWSPIWAGKTGTAGEHVLVRMRKGAGRGAGERGVAVLKPTAISLVIVPQTLRFESISFPPGFSYFLCLLPQTVHPPSLPPTKVTTQQALINVIFFLKVALEKGNLTAVRQNRELKASRPLSTRAQPQEQNEEGCCTAWGPW